MKPAWLKSSSAIALLAVAGLAANLAPLPAHAGSIDTTTSWNGSSVITVWGTPNTATYGQTFTATATNARLNDFTFYLEHPSFGGDGVNGTANYQAYVYQWDSVNNRTTGSALYSSSVLTAPSSSSLTPVTFNTGSLSLTSGQAYVAFLTTSGVTNTGSGTYYWGMLYSRPYSGGQFVYNNNGTNFSLLSSTAWSNFHYDLAFKMDFTPAVSDIDTAQPSYGSSGLGTWLNPHFVGGTLKIDQANATYAEAFTLDSSATNTIDANGNTVTFTGNFSPDTVGITPDLTLTDTAGGGGIQVSGSWGTTAAPMGTITNSTTLEVLSGGSVTATDIVNTWPHMFTIDAGATVTGRLSNSNDVENKGTYNGDASNGSFIINEGVWNGSLSQASSGILDNRAGAVWTGTLDDKGELYNYGTWIGDATVETTGVVWNEGTWTGAITNAGIFANSGTVSGLLTQTAGAQSDNFSTLNGGAIVAANSLLLNAGTINGGLRNSGITAANPSTIIGVPGAINGAIVNTSGGEFRVFGYVATNVPSTLVTSDSTFDNQSGGLLEVFKDAHYQLGGTLTNDGTVTINTGGSISAGGLGNTGNVNVNAGATFAGPVTNSGDIENWGAVTGTANNSATLDNQSGATWTGNAVNGSAGTLYNAGTWTGTLSNAGAFTNDTGGTLSGLLTQTGGTTLNNGTLSGGLAVTGGIVYTAGTIGGGVTNAGMVQGLGGAINGAIVNQSGGVFDINGAVTSDATFNNQSGARAYIYSSYEVAGTLTNAGKLYVEKNSLFTDAAGASNSGGIGVLSGGVWSGNATNLAAGTIENAGTWTGALTNAGTFINDPTGTLSGLLTQTAGTATNGGALNGGATLGGGGLTTTGTIKGGLTNAGVVNANGGAVNGAIANNSGGAFNVGGAVTSDTSFANASGASLTVLNGGSYTLAGALTNAGTAWVTSGGTLKAGSVSNSGTLEIDQGGTLSDALTNTGTVSNSGVYNADVNNNGAVAVIVNTATGVWNGNLTNGTGATASTAGAWNGAVSNAGAVYASGQVNGAITNSGTFTVTGVLTGNGSAFGNTGTLSVGGSSFTGIGAFSNSGTVSVGTGAANGTLGVASLNNNGALKLQNGKTGDSITVSGAYTAGGGSLALDVNLANGQGDRLSAASTGGTTIVSILNVGSAKLWLSTPIVLVSASGGGSGTFTAAADAQTQAALASNGIVGYRLQKLNDGTDWGLVSTLNAAAVSTVANHTALFLNTLDTGLRPTTHDLLAEPAGEGWSGHVWMRAAHAGSLMRATTASDDGYTAPADTLTQLEADGVMAGAETQRTGSGSTLQLGLMAGWTDAWAKDDGGYGSRFHTPSVGAYGVLSARHLLLGVQAWRDDLSMRPDGLIATGDIHGYNDEVIVSLSVPVTRGIYTFEPYAGYRASSTHIDPVAVQGGTGTLGFASLSGDTAGGGVRLSAVGIKDGVRFKPYVSVGVETVSGHGERSVFTPTGGGSPVTLTTTGPGTYTTVSTGVEVLFPSGLQAYGRVDGRTGSAVNGLSLVGGVRTRF